MGASRGRGIVSRCTTSKPSSFAMRRSGFDPPLGSTRSSIIGRLVILTGNHLCNNPRVIKEAGTLARAGYDVTVLGAWLDRALKDRDQKIIQSAPLRFVSVWWFQA